MSSRAHAEEETPLPDPPPPASLLDLPKPWLLKLVTSPHVSFTESFGRIRVPLFGTCTSLREHVMMHRKAKATLYLMLPFSPEDLAREVTRLATVSKCCSNIGLEFRPPWAWAVPCLCSGPEPEVDITRLLEGAKAKLGGEVALLGVKEITVEYLELSALVPAWVKELCPTVERLHFASTAIIPAPPPTASEAYGMQPPYTPPPPPTAPPALPPAPLPPTTQPLSPAPAPYATQPPAPPTSPQAPAAVTLRHLDHLSWDFPGQLVKTPASNSDPGTLTRHLRSAARFPHADLATLTPDCIAHHRRAAQLLHAELATLPSLTSLFVGSPGNWLVEGAEGRTHTGITKLALGDSWPCENPVLNWPQLLALFPSLLELKIKMKVDDAALEAMLSHPRLQNVSLENMDLHHSHVHRPPAQPWKQLRVVSVDVDVLAMLPLDSIQALECSGVITPSRDALAVERVAQAIRRSGGLDQERTHPTIFASDSTALLTTLGPLLAALPEAQRQELDIRDLPDATPEVVRQLGQQLPPSVARLSLDSFRLEAEAWPVLLPSLPATVAHLQLSCYHFAFSREDVVAMCAAAVRPIEVTVPWSKGAVAEVRATVEALSDQRGSAVTLISWAWGAEA